jgi:alpha-tubulin suppressor-like RCC1 family protein
LTDESDVYCWRLNENGQLLYADGFRSADPIRIDVGRTFTEISAGLANTCGVTNEGEVFCWAFGSPLEQWRVLAHVRGPDAGPAPQGPATR